MGKSESEGKLARISKFFGWTILAVLILVRVAEKGEWGDLIVGAVAIFYINLIGSLERRIFKIEDESLPKRLTRIEEVLDIVVAKTQDSFEKRIERLEAQFEKRIESIEMRHDRRISRLEDEPLVRRD